MENNRLKLKECLNTLQSVRLRSRETLQFIEDNTAWIVVIFRAL